MTSLGDEFVASSLAFGDRDDERDVNQAGAPLPYPWQGSAPYPWQGYGAGSPTGPGGGSGR